MRRPASYLAAFALALLAACAPESGAPTISAADVPRFWEAYDRVVGWSDDGRTRTVDVELPGGGPAQVLLTSQFLAQDGPALEPFLLELATR